MWLVFAVISLMCYAFSDLLGKKHTDNSDALASVKLIASSNAVACITGLIIYLFHIGESGLPPWQLIFDNPMILLSMLCFVLYWLFFLLSVRYVGLSMNEAVQSTFGAFYFAGLILINLITGRLSSVRGMLHPFRLIPVILVIIFTIFLPNTEVIAQRKQNKSLVKSKAERRNVIIGFVLLIIATLFDSLDSIIATAILDSGSIGTVDYMQASYFSYGLTFVILSVFIMIKTKKAFIPFVKCGKQSFPYTLTALFSSVFYLLSCSYDAVRTGILFIAYPIVPIIGAKILLKEKYTARQNICIWTITISSILFCVADSIV